MIQKAELRERLVLVLQGKVPLFEFADWVESRSWNMHADSEADAIDLASSIHSLFSQYDDRLLSEELVREQLAQLFNSVHESISMRDHSVSPHRKPFVTSLFNQWAAPLAVRV
jgi:hypothetical protein